MRRPILPLSMLLVAGAALAAPRSPEEQARIAAVTAPPASFAAPEPFEALPGGRATLRGERARGPGAFAAPVPGLADPLDAELGAALFAKLWVAAPSTTRASDGLGPLYNARSCLGCHPGNGRGRPAEPGRTGQGMILRLSAADASPHPLLGEQLQDLALPGLAPEGRLTVGWQDRTVPLAGGEVAHLRRPVIAVDPALPPGTRISARVAQPMTGLGLLAAIPDADILALEDPQDRDGDGISGRANRLPGPDGRVRLGRFGWKAGHATLADQVASAFALDIGISSPSRPAGWGDCTPAQAGCRARPDGHDPGLRDGVEIDGRALALVALHLASRAVPERRDIADPQVLRGKALFHETGCPACHRPKFVTDRLPAAAPASLSRSFQLIWPYSDLLLHDMGPGLADDRPEAGAGGQEWRTPPLWGLGLTQAVSGHRLLLHDGRARGVLEAVLWHGGEAQAARDRVAALPPADRAALIRFLESL
ncbi:di-heme oxidoreductase family protein [Frigidibacter oleivorans]|uniref:di-heme oxidoreductase family protein n=1 Tax=Frigidibacter oleivorans TaxID=2487129 RepID=UPI000F8CACF1|nr:di-heme oxidoredictase family protein [Frigidibacter oleivorans]